MSGKCGNCDCADASKCVQQGNKNVLEAVVTEKISSVEAAAMASPAAENDSKCKCGASCGCVNCSCGH